MDDPVQRHPTRVEQLDILATIVADLAQPGDRMLDLGCGTGFVAYLILPRIPQLAWTGVDLKPESLDAARRNLAEFKDRIQLFEGDLMALESLDVPPGPYRFIHSGLVFHDLDDGAKRALIGWAARRLTPDGWFLLYDRVRLTEPRLFPLQKSVWDRLERVHGYGMRSAPDFDSYIADLKETNRPAPLANYFQWFPEAGLTAACLHLHGNIALIAGAPNGSSGD